MSDDQDQPPGKLPLVRYAVFTFCILLLWGIVFFFSELRYMDGNGKVDDARQTLHILERACKSYALKNDGNAPATLELLIRPPDGGLPFVEGGEAALLDPWGKPFRYVPGNRLDNGEPDPLVYIIHPTTQQRIFSVSRQRLQD